MSYANERFELHIEDKATGRSERPRKYPSLAAAKQAAKPWLGRSGSDKKPGPRPFRVVIVDLRRHAADPAAVVFTSA